ncbi:uncharacterized protein LOC119665270 [Teleopsis dalmanni]|nr:uncharacterized protein LOC119665270 [Teleopsis dalmanni]
MYPETYRYLYFRNNETFYQTYIPFYTNISGYLCGIICSDVFLKLVNNNNNATQNYHRILKYKLAWWSLIPMFFVLISIGTLMMEQTFEKPSIFVAIFAGLYKNLWVIICGLFVFGMCFKMGGIFHKTSVLPSSTVLAKISFQAYLWHFAILHLMATLYRPPIYISRLNVITIIICSYIFSNIVAFFITTCFEYPINGFIKMSKRRDYKFRNNNNNTLELNSK